MKKIDEVINNILVELDSEQAKYQQLYYNFHNKEDEMAKFIHKKMVALCEKIRRKVKE